MQASRHSVSGNQNAWPMGWGGAMWGVYKGAASPHRERGNARRERERPALPRPGARTRATGGGGREVVFGLGGELTGWGRRSFAGDDGERARRRSCR